MSAFTDAINSLNAYNAGTYSPATNPKGYSGIGGMDANWIPTLRAVAAVANGIAETGQQADQNAQTIAGIQADLTAKHGTVVTLASQVAADKVAVNGSKAQIDAQFAAIAAGPVASVNGRGGVVSGVAEATLSNVSREAVVGRSTVVTGTDPAATHDLAHGYAVGTRWINTATKREWIALDVTNGAAVWWDSAAPLPTGTATFSGGTLTLDMAGRAFAEFSHTVTANITAMVFANRSTLGTSLALLRLTNAGSYSVATPANAKAAGGVATGLGAFTAVGRDDVLYRIKGDGSEVVVSAKKDVKA